MDHPTKDACAHYDGQARTNLNVGHNECSSLPSILRNMIKLLLITKPVESTYRSVAQMWRTYDDSARADVVAGCAECFGTATDGSGEGLSIFGVAKHYSSIDTILDNSRHLTSSKVSNLSTLASKTTSLDMTLGETR
jgi:hypothetical protein